MRRTECGDGERREKEGEKGKVRKSIRNSTGGKIQGMKKWRTETRKRKKWEEREERE